jgi:hypothetical protein
MRFPSTRRRRLGGAVAILALAAGCLVTAAGSAGAAPSVVDCDPAGTVMLNPTTVDAGGQVNVGWNVILVAGCNPPITSERMSGPGFSGDEVLPTLAGNRPVTLTQPGTATWILSVTTRFGETELYRASATVNPPPPLVTGLAGGAVAFIDVGSTQTKAEVNEYVPSTGSAVRPGTRPSLFNVGTDYEAAYQGTDGHLWVVDPAGTATDTGLGMMAGTSPSITATGGTTFTVAFQANTGQLWSYSTETGGRSVGLAMALNTSPSATLTSAGVAIAYVDPNGKLSVFDPATGYGGFGAPVAAGTSPAITYIPRLADGYRITYQGTDHQVRTADSSGVQSATLLTAASGTSPAITTLPSGEIDIAVNGPDGTVHTVTSTGALTNTGALFQTGTSPSIAPAAGGGAVTAWQNVRNEMSTFAPGTGVTSTGLTMFAGTSPSIAQITSITR